MSVGTRNVKHWVRLLVVGLLLVSGQGCHHWGCYQIPPDLVVKSQAVAIVDVI